MSEDAGMPRPEGRGAVTDHDLEQIRAIIGAELAPIRAQLAELQTKISTWPDLNFLQAAAQQQMNEAQQARSFRRDVEIKLDELRAGVRGHTRTLNVVLQDVRLIRAAINDAARESVTPGELEAIHHDLNAMRQELSALVGRVETIEERDGR